MSIVVDASSLLCLAFDDEGVLQPIPADAGVLDLARRLRLSVYDASYLDLALRENVPLATLDQVLRDAGQRVRVRCWEPGVPPA